MSNPNSSPSLAMQPLKSSNIASVGYDPAAKALHVRFKSGGTYAYTGATAEKHYQNMLRAPSAGSYFHKSVKSDRSLTTKAV